MVGCGGGALLAILTVMQTGGCAGHRAGSSRAPSRARRVDVAARGCDRDRGRDRADGVRGSAADRERVRSPQSQLAKTADLSASPAIDPVDVRRLPEVAAAGRVAYVFLAFPDFSDQGRRVVPFVAGDSDQYATVDRGVLLAGRRADPRQVREVTVSPGMAAASSPLPRGSRAGPDGHARGRQAHARGRGARSARSDRRSHGRRCRTPTDRSCRVTRKPGCGVSGRKRDRLPHTRVLTRVHRAGPRSRLPQ